MSDRSQTWKPADRWPFASEIADADGLVLFQLVKHDPGIGPALPVGDSTRVGQAAGHWSGTIDGHAVHHAEVHPVLTWRSSTLGKRPLHR